MSEKSLREFHALLAEIQLESYQNGWNDAVKKILAAAQEGTPLADQTVHSAPAPEKPPTYQPETPIIFMVYEIVKENPGLRGHEIVKEIITRDPHIPPKVADRTGRTSLSRLEKRDHKIINRNSRWYPAVMEDIQKEPATGSLALSEPGPR